MKKRMLATVMAVSMVAAGLAGCGGSKTCLLYTSRTVMRNGR